MSPNDEPVPQLTSEGDSSISSINQVQAIERSRNAMIKTRAEVGEYVELPLLPACLDLWDKNVRTLATSANARDLYDGRSYIILDFDSLSEHNKRVAQGLGDLNDYDGFKAISIDLPVSERTLVTELSSKAEEVARQFRKQKPRWIPAYTLEQLKQFSRIPADNHEFDAPEAWQEYGLFYDADSGKYFMSQEHFEKTLEEIEE